MGGYVDNDERKKGKYTEMLFSLFYMFPIGTTVQVAIAHKGLIPLFKRLGFEKVKQIEYWGEAENTMQGTNINIKV